jgi:hypothetical protein
VSFLLRVKTILDIANFFSSIKLINKLIKIMINQSTDSNFSNKKDDFKTSLKEFLLKENRAKINCKIFIVDFDSVANLDNFVSTIAKVLIANKYLSNISLSTTSNMVNFSSTYDKSRRSFSYLNSLFQIVEERNTKVIAAGIFGFSERLKIFLDDETKHSEAFSLFLKEKNIEINELYSMSKSDVEDLVTLT